MCKAIRSKPVCGQWWRSGSQACSVPKALFRNDEMTVCRWLLMPSTILQLPQSETAGEQTALIKWQFARSKILSSWDEHFIRHFPGQCVPDGPPAEIERANWIIFLWLWCPGWQGKFSAPGLRLLMFGLMQWAPLLSGDIHPAPLLKDDLHPAPLLNDDLHPAVAASIFISFFPETWFFMIFSVPVVAHWCLPPCTCEG